MIAKKYYKSANNEVPLPCFPSPSPAPSTPYSNIFSFYLWHWELKPGVLYPKAITPILF